MHTVTERSRCMVLLLTALLFLISNRVGLQSDEGIKIAARGYEKERAAFYETIPPDLLPVLKRLFEPKAVRIDCRVVEIRGTHKSILSTYSLWFSRGELFLRHQLPAPENINYVTVGGQLYRWKTGSPTGVILNRMDGDTLHYARYAVDPGWIMAGLYERLRQDPTQLIVRKHHGTTVVQGKDKWSSDLLVGFAFVENPLWFSQLILRYPDRVVVWEYDVPNLIDAIPETIRALPNGVHFMRSTKSLFDFITFL